MSPTRWSTAIAPGRGGSALPSFYSSRMRFDQGCLVRFRSLDSVLPELPEGPVVVKVDVEGTEDEVFRHGQRFLAERRPDVLCEVLAGVADPEVLEGLLAPHGYRWYLVTEGGLEARERLEPHPRYRDWLFTQRTPEALRALGIRVEGTPTLPGQGEERGEGRRW